jgi:DNA-binding MarR family transcriptional regulator
MLSTIARIKYNESIMDATPIATPSQVCEQFLSLLGKFKACINELAEEYGLTQVQAHALYILHQRGSIPMGYVAEALHCDASNVTGIVDRLVSQNLVTRSEDPNDRRTKLLILSDRGNEVIQKFFQRLPHKLGFTNLNAKDRTTLLVITQKLSI